MTRKIIKKTKKYITTWFLLDSKKFKEMKFGEVEINPDWVKNIIISHGK
jgi:hypothetical protein